MTILSNRYRGQTGSSFLFSLCLIVFFVSGISSNGFAHSNFNFTPSLSISEEYDSNVYSIASSTEDYVTKIGTNLNAAYNGQNVELKGGYLLNFNSYARQPKANVFTHGGNMNIGLSRWLQKLSKGGGLTITEDFTITPDLTDSNNGTGTLGNYGIKTVRSNMFRNSAGFNVTLPVTQLLSLNTSYSNTLTDYSSSLYKDNETNTLGLGITYSLKQDTLYSNLNATTTRADRQDSLSYSFTFGARHPFSQFISFDANTGISLVAPESGKNESTMRGSVGLTKRMEWHTFSTGYSRNLNTTSGISGTPVIADVYYLNLSNIHSPYLSSEIGANYSTNRSIKGSDVDTQSYNLSGSLNYTIRKWLSCSFNLSHFNQTSHIAAISEMKRNQITFSIVSTWL